MLAALGLIGFLAYNISLFCLSQIWLLSLLAGTNLLLLLLCGPKHYRTILRPLLGSAGLVLFVGVWNLLFLGPEKALLYSLRLLDALFATILLSRLLTSANLAQGLRVLLAPLGWFKINPQLLILSIVLAINLIPIMIREARSVETALRLKGLKFSLRNFLTRPQIFVVTYFRAVFTRADYMTKALLLKGYE